MFKNFRVKFAMVTVAIWVQVLSPLAMAADVSIAKLNISGNVPTVFSVTVRGIPGDLDLTPGVDVNDRLLGIVHFKYNVALASLDMRSDTANGKPRKGATDYDWGAADFTLKFGSCTTVDDTYEADFNITNGALDIKDAATATITVGEEEDCDLTAAWDGTTADLPLAGKYSMVITFTMTSI